jgi:hypothetical protein
MKAFVVEQYGEDGLRAADIPEPEVGAGDVLVEVSAAGVNPLDAMVRNGEFKRLLKYRTPFVLGHDVAGVVTSVGSAVRDFQVGDEVYARPRDLRIGTFAEYIAIDQHDVAPKPASLSLHEAAAVPLVSLAAWQALVDRAHLKPGQKVLVHAGSGGLGSTVIQLAKHLGATVATASGENAGLMRRLGAAGPGGLAARRRREPSARGAAAEPPPPGAAMRPRAPVVGDRHAGRNRRLDVCERDSELDLRSRPPHGISTSLTWMATVRCATNLGSSASAPAGSLASTCHHRPCPPARQLDGTRRCLRGLSKPCQAANAAAHSCGSCRWFRRKAGMGGSWPESAPGSSGATPEPGP